MFYKNYISIKNNLIERKKIEKFLRQKEYKSHIKFINYYLDTIKLATLNAFYDYRKCRL